MTLEEANAILEKYYEAEERFHKLLAEYFAVRWVEPDVPQPHPSLKPLTPEAFQKIKVAKGEADELWRQFSVEPKG